MIPLSRALCKSLLVFHCNYMSVTTTTTTTTTTTNVRIIYSAAVTQLQGHFTKSTSKTVAQLNADVC